MKRALLFIAACGTPDPEPALDACSEPCFPEQRVDWFFYPSVSGPAMTGGCRDGVATVELATSENVTATYPCGHGTGVVAAKFPHRVLARLRSAANDVVAESLIFQSLGQARIVANFYEDGGFLRVVYRSESFNGMMGCEGTETMWVAPRDPLGQPGASFRGNCKLDRLSGELVTGGLRAGEYDITITGAVATHARTVMIGANNAVTEISVDVRR